MPLDQDTKKPHYMAQMTPLDELEEESIYIFREVAAEFEKPVLLYSVGKDSSTLVHLARKAFAPEPIPFPVMHIDTGYKFKEMYEFRDNFVRQYGLELIVFKNQPAIESKSNPYDLGISKCCELLKTTALLNALKHYQNDAAIGGARREEEKSRAKERIFSIRDRHGHWNPKEQRPELWQLYNTRLSNGQTMRVFPLSNWTELDIWKYIARENIPVVPLYFAKPREVVKIGRKLIPIAGFLNSSLPTNAKIETVSCRFRTLGCMPCTSAIESQAATIPEIIQELEQTRYSERITRLIDHDVSFAMEKKKQEGYF